MSKLVYVVILAWNHIDDTLEAIKSFKQDIYFNKIIVMVDNGSTDRTMNIIEKQYPDVKIIRSEKNLGVSGGYNLGIEYAIKQAADYILIANNDIVTEIDMISTLVNSLENDDVAGVAMPKIYHYYGDRNRLWCTGAHWRKFPPTVKMSNFNRLDRKTSSIPNYIDFAPSCVLLLRRQLVEKIGLFNTSFFFYFDDWDYSKRVRNAQYKILFVPEARMWHKVSLSTQKTKNNAEWWKKMGFSAALYYSKYHSPIENYAFFLWFVIREMIKGKPRRSISFLQGVIEFKQKQASNNF